ncbi:MAG: hypothetical protein ACKVPZ_02210 [Burkholderiaceae bacterium]
MDFNNTWYIIEHQKKYEVISHKDMMALDASSYQMIQNYRTHHDALMEMSRLVTQDIANVHEKLNHLKK